MVTDTEVILKALKKERDELHERLMQIDRIVKRVREGEYTGQLPQQAQITELIAVPVQPSIIPLTGFPKEADIKVQVIKVFDDLRKASRLGEIQSRYYELSGSNYNLRETIRSLHRARLVKLVRVKDSARGMFWLKADWIQNGQIMEDYKPEGFDLLYKPESLIFE